MVEVDCGWRTGLGTCFYGRVSESRRLAGLLGRPYTTIVLVGARNVGKSELAKYFVERSAGLRPLVVDARLARGGVLGLPGRLAEEVARLIAGMAGLGRLLDIAVEALKALSADRVLVVDEFHLASRDPLGDLEALAKMVGFYPEYEGWRVVATTSEGSLLSYNLASRLEGYRALVYTVEPLSWEDMKALYEEYRSLRGCRVGWEAYWSLAGGLPGYLPFLCAMGEGELEEWLGGLVERVREALIELGNRSLEAAFKLLVEGREASSGDLLRVGRGLVERNIAYPKGLRFEPQLNAYKAILALWFERGSPPTPREVLRAAGAVS